MNTDKIELLKEGSIYKKEDQLRIQERFNTVEIMTELPKGATVRILNSCYPGKEFRELYPDNPIVTRNSDITVIKRNQIIGREGSNRRQVYVGWDHNNHKPRVAGNSDITLMYHDQFSFNPDVNFYNSIISGKVILAELLKAPVSGETMTREQYESMKDYFRSTDKQMQQIGWNLMLRYDYETSKEFFVLLICHSKYQSSHLNTRQKAIVKKLREEFLYI